MIVLGKLVQDWWNRWEMVPGIGCPFKCFLGTLGVIEELKNPCDYRG